MTISFTLDKTKVKPGETVRVSWTLRNGWTKSYPFKIEFKIDGSPLRTIDLGTVYSGQTKTGSFTFTAPKTSGTYTIEAISYLSVYGQWTDEDSYTKTLTVEQVIIPPKGEIQYINVNGNSVRNGGSVTIDKASISVSIGVANTGGVGTIVINVAIKDSSGNGVYSSTKTVSLGANSSTTVTFSTTLPKPDTYSVTVSVGH